MYGSGDAGAIGSSGIEGAGCATDGADRFRLAVRALLVLYLVQPGGYDFRVIARYPVNLQRVELLALLVILHAVLEVRLVLPRPRDDVAVGGLVGQQGFQTDAPLVHRLNHRLALLLGLGFLNEAYLVFGDAVVFHQLALDFAVRIPLVGLVRAQVAEHELRALVLGIAVVILRNHVGAMGRLVGAE